MRIFLAGASGVIGIRLVPLLAEAGHDVAGMTRTPPRCDALRSLGATPVLCDAYDAEALRDVVVDFRPELVLHQLTDLPDDEGQLPTLGSANARMRRAGTANLLAAARAAGSARFVAQSVAWELPGDSGAANADGVTRAAAIPSRYVAIRSAAPASAALSSPIGRSYAAARPR